MEKKFVYGGAGLLCLLAVLPLPYGFYTFLRLAVSIAGVFSAIELKREENFLWLFFGAIVLLFNPIIPIYLTREVWFPIDLFVAGCFAWLTFRK
ncbi:hypothetical protein OAP51_07215 [Alphaproteobacteria bacterium]|nr:hypothetical protein [Alphaproteobacteria bacterium]